MSIAPQIQAAIYNGYMQAANVLGAPFELFRPDGADTPIQQANRIGTINVSMDANVYKFRTPQLYGKPVWYALADGSRLAVADYLQGDTGTYFVAAMQPLLPIAIVECNRVLNVLRPYSAPGVGVLPYGGDIASEEVSVMTAFPGSVLTKSRGERGETNLPGDVRVAWYEVLLPYVGVEIKFADVIDTDNGMRLKVGTVERTELGFRMLAQYAGT